MSKEQKEKLLPDLRFPRFRNMEGWDLIEVGDIFQLTRGNVLAMGFVQQHWSEDAPYPVYSSQTKNNGLAGYYKDYLFENAITWTTDGANAGDVNYRSGKFYCTNVCGVLISEKGYANLCISALINSVSKNYVSYVGNPKLMNGVMSKIKIPIPSLSEQQKIADCLSSLEELITSEIRKLEVLKKHKKGLMQQLFPVEGAKVPKLRFSEFRDSTEWVETELGSVASFINGRAFKQDELLDKGKYQVLRVGNFFTNNEWYYSDLELEEDKYCEEGDLLYAWSASFGPRIWKGEKAIYHYHIWKVLNNSQIDKSFLFMLLNYETEKMTSKSANGFALLHITKGTIEGWKCKVPKSTREQKEISACLASFDALIANQSQKLDSLKSHKTGLMQQLFPKLEPPKDE